METKPDLLNDIELRSDSVQDILTRPPHWMVLWGNTLLLVLILMLILISYFIKYPEFIEAPIMVTSQNTPENIISGADSKVAKILVKDHQTVKKGDVLMVLQSDANYKDVLELKKLIDSLPTTSVSSFPFTATSKFNLGQLQSDYDYFVKTLQNQESAVQVKTNFTENRAVSQEIAEDKAKIDMLTQQLELEKARLLLYQKNYDQSQSLYSKGKISKIELENNQLKFFQTQQNVKNIELLIKQLRKNIVNLNKINDAAEVIDPDNQTSDAANSIQALKKMRESLNRWEQKFLIVASTNGIISFPKFYEENQIVKAGDLMVSILPNNQSDLVGIMEVPSLNSGKILPGQKVIIKLDNFPYQEYGTIQGKVISMSLTPNDKGKYSVTVGLPDGLKTTYHKHLPYERTLIGNAHIVTKDIRLIERFFNKTKELIGQKD